MWEMAATVFVASLAGSVHCVGMCGPFVALTTIGRAKVRRPIGPTAAYNLGRGIAYAGVGALAGTIGLGIDAGGHLAGMQRAAATLAGVTMIVIGAVWLLDLLGGSRSFARTRSTVTEAIAARLRSGFASSRRLGPIPRAAMLGVLTSLMPCGWLYAFALTAAGTGSPLGGAALMVAFWAGNVPILMAFGAGVHRLSPLVRRRLPIVMAGLVLAVGVFTVAFRSTIVVEPSSATPTEASTPEIPSTPPCHAS
jgi:uncharacterized protein